MNGIRTYAVSLKSFREFLDPDKLAGRVRALASDYTRSKWRRIALQEFLRSYSEEAAEND